MQPSPELWRALALRRLPADEQAAWTELLLNGVQESGVPALRWRETAPEALLLGRGQPLTDVDIGACRAAGVRVSRRATGGTAVLSGPDLLGLDIILPAGHWLAIANVTESYRWLGEALADGLRTFSIAADAVSPDAARAQTRSVEPNDPVRRACFATLSPYEVAVAGRKLIGLAQARRRSGVLFQAAILLRWDAERLARLLAIPDGASVHALHDRAIGLDEVGLPLERDSLIERLAGAVAAAAGAELRADDWSAAERAAIARTRAQFGALA